MIDFKELSLAIARIILGIVVLIEGLIVLDIVIHITSIGNIFSDKVMAAYEDGYNKGYTQTFSTGYQDAYSEAYTRGYSKGYEVSLMDGPEVLVPARVALRNPTYSEMRDFLTRDKTDYNEYISGEYVCFEFATELNNNAEANGIRAAYVRLRFNEWAHAVVAFDTVDRGLIFIEPQSDMEVELNIGKPYPWLTAGADITASLDTVILQIQFIW